MVFWTTYQFVRGTTNGEDLKEFIERGLLSHLLPFNGVNSNSIVVMDNASIHHSQDAADLVGIVGALLIFLPPYSPDLNLIKEAFSSVNAYHMTQNAYLMTQRELYRLHLIVSVPKIGFPTVVE